MAKTYPRLNLVGEPEFDRPVNEIAAEVQIDGALVVKNAREYHSDRQRAWYWAVAVKALEDAGYSQGEADMVLKATCGADLLKKETLYIGRDADNKPITATRHSIAGVGKQKFSKFIDNIIAASITNEWFIQPPDPELRS